MNGDGTHENGRQRMGFSNRMHDPWNMMHQHQMKDPNSHPMSKKISNIIVERDAAIHERNMALAEKKQALLERDAALEQRDKAIAERNNALMERDNAIAALQFRNQFNNGAQRGQKRGNHYDDLDDELNHNDSFPISMLTSEAERSSPTEQTKLKSTATPQKKKGKLMNSDLNMGSSQSNGTKVKPDWDNQELGLNLIHFDETIMPAPVCSCTGIHRQCYKGGNGGWQSSCCTTTLSSYPLPQMANKRHSRMGGRKMGGNVFSRLITRLAAEGHDLSLPVDLKDYWAKHGTNRYILIK